MQYRVSAALRDKLDAERGIVRRPTVRDNGGAAKQPATQRSSSRRERRNHNWHDRPYFTLAEAVARYNADHARDWKAQGGRKRQCPICRHKGCFVVLPKSPDRWACFSAGHPADIGIPGRGCFTGDALDVDAHRAGHTLTHREARIALLREQGYLSAMKPGARPHTRARASEQ